MYLNDSGNYYAEYIGNRHSIVYFQATDGTIFKVKDYKYYTRACKYASKMNSSKQVIC